MKRFQPSKFRGRWYDLAKTSDPYSDTLHCVMTQYKPLGSAGLRIVKKALDVSNNVVSLEADAIFIDPSKCDGATVITEDDREGVYYTVVSTNYKDYAVVVACTLDLAPLNKWAWIQSRRPRLHRDTLQVLHQLLEAYGFAPNELSLQNFSSCHDMRKKPLNTSHPANVLLF
ncbi:apolipoprotein D-like [Amblyomma americanum]